MTDYTWPVREIPRFGGGVQKIHIHAVRLKGSATSNVIVCPDIWTRSQQIEHLSTVAIGLANEVGPEADCELVLLPDEMITPLVLKRITKRLPPVPLNGVAPMQAGQVGLHLGGLPAIDPRELVGPPVPPAQRQEEHLAWLNEPSNAARLAGAAPAIYAEHGRGFWLAQWGHPEGTPMDYIPGEHLDKVPAGQTRAVVGDMVASYDPVIQAVVVIEDGGMYAYKIRFAEPELPEPRVKWTAQEVLDHHADLYRRLAHPGQGMRAFFWGFAEDVIKTRAPNSVRMLLHPMENYTESETGRWIAAIASGLHGSVTYQITGEMVGLAESLMGRPLEKRIVLRELPASWGFAWLDRPWINTDRHGKRCAVRVITWAQIPFLEYMEAEDGPLKSGSAVRIALWGLDGDRDDYAYQVTDSERANWLANLGPLTLLHQQVMPTGVDYGDDQVTHFLHTLWLLMDMEITQATPADIGRGARRRARDLRQQAVRVVALRRVRHASAEPSGTHRHIDWSCRWIVRGHERKLASGKVTWVRPHLKGPDGAPLKTTDDIVYRLER